MLPALLIVLFTLWFLFSVSVMIGRRHDLHALAYSVLFLYTIFTQIGYAYYPELSASLGAYFGAGMFYDYWLFMYLSFVASFLVYLVLTRARSTDASYDVVDNAWRAGTVVFYLSAFLILGTVGWAFFHNTNMALYGAGELTFGGNLFRLGFRFVGLVAIIFYVYARSYAHSLSQRVSSLFAFTISLVLFVQIAIAAGSRSELLYLMSGMVMFEVHPFVETLRIHRMKLIVLTLAMLVVVYPLLVLEYVRCRVSPITLKVVAESFSQVGLVLGTTNVIQSFLLRDYFAPSHTLFVSMEYGMVGPVEVLKSNMANLLVGLRYPTLSQMIVGNASSDIGRGYGWAFYLFVEGYNAVGWLGIAYNALIWNAGLLMWNSLASSNNTRLNRAIIAIEAVLIINMMREQSSWFLKYVWLILMPTLGLLFLAVNVRLSLRRQGCNADAAVDR